jgi:hypothetical protein
MERRFGDKFRQQTRKKSQFENASNVKDGISKTQSSFFYNKNKLVNDLSLWVRTAWHASC